MLTLTLLMWMSLFIIRKKTFKVKVPKFTLFFWRSSLSLIISKLDNAKPDISKPDIAKPDSAKPYIDKSDIAKPDIAIPDILSLIFLTAKPDITKPDS